MYRKRSNIPKRSPTQLLRSFHTAINRTGIWLVLNVSVGGNSIPFIFVVRVHSSLGLLFHVALNSVCNYIVAWTHCQDETVPNFIIWPAIKIVDKNWLFLKLFDMFVVQNGPFLPLKLFKCFFRLFCFKSKNTVDRALQR